ncbi:MAG: CvpA family protein [Clostridia bacterium]|nr:CvpA family protein [Clostridia bacterium]
MPYIIDIIFILILAVVVITSVKKGFIVSLFELVGTIASFVAARLLSDSLASPVFEKFVAPGAEKLLSENLGEVATTDYGAQIESAINSIPDFFTSILSLMGIDKAELVEKVASSDFASGTLLDSLMESVVTPVGTAVVQFILFAVLVALITLVLRVLVRLLDKIIKKIPAIKQMNSALGGVVGAARGVLTVVILSILLAVAAGFINNESFITAVEGSFIVGTVQNLFTTFSGITI